MRIVGNIVPREWADTAFIVNCGLAVTFWTFLIVVTGTLAGLLPRDWLREIPDAQLGAAVALLILTAAVMCTTVAVKVWRETGDGDE